MRATAIVRLSHLPTRHMVFNSIAFALFLPVVLLLYHLSTRNGKIWVLLIAGYVFYGAWDVRFLYLVSVSAALDYCTGLMIGRGYMKLGQRMAASLYVLGFALVFLVPDWAAVSLDGGLFNSANLHRILQFTQFGINVFLSTLLVVATAHVLYPILVLRLTEDQRRRFFLLCSLIGQLGMLAIFKYYNFFIDSADRLLSQIGLSAAGLHLDIVLPIGISFYTFQTLSYVCDVYWRRMQPVDRLRDFALFVGYFPPLVAGPIERASHLIPRILAERRVTFNHVAQGGYLILLGLFKKIAIADGLADSVSSVYNSTGSVGWLDIAVSTVAFALQIYGDFSGYSDIACGVSLWFGIELLRNFNLPYFAVNPSEFWRRWHISLSTWLRDYLYIPLGGNRGGEVKTNRNLMLTMLLGGLWHGAAWNFVLWGFYQGLLLVVHRLATGAKIVSQPDSLLWRAPRMLFFFVFVCYGWLLFRANSLDQIVLFTSTLLTDFSDMSLSMKRPPLGALLGLPLLLLIEVLQFKYGTIHFYTRIPLVLHGTIYALLFIFLFLGLSYGGSQQFIYFQF